jgi:hypothetical protein
MRPTRFLLFAALALGPPAHADDFTCSLTDPQGDANLSASQGFVAEPYQDIVRSGIARRGQLVLFTMDVAAPIPEVTELKSRNGVPVWAWGISRSYPLAPSGFGGLMFSVDVRPDGRQYRAEFVDGRPSSLSGGQRFTWKVSLKIRGSRVTVAVPATLFEDPEGDLYWGAWTWALPGNDPKGARQLDVAPVGAATCSWTTSRP